MPDTQFTYQPTQLPPQQPNITPSNVNGVNAGNQPKRNTEGIKNIVYTILLFIFAPIFALLMIMFVFQSYVVDGSSMEPSLQNGNRVFILKLPKTIANIRNKEYIPGRYEVVVFKKPNDPSVQLIKRVVGLPGDRVVIKDSQITIYNSDNPEGFKPDEQMDVNLLIGDSVADNDITVGYGELFVCGDNRSPGGSLDSRNNLGLVPARNIIGRLWIRYYPLSSFKHFSDLKYAQQFWQILPLSYRL